MLAEDKLFATLDPTTRRLRLPREREIIITDTVGFIRDLPLDLARAFRATLEELDEADLLLHVVDAADPARDQQTAAVETILADLGLAETPRILVMNKIDLLPPTTNARASGAPTAICRWSPSRRRTAPRPTPLLEAIEAALCSAGIVTPHLAGDGAESCAGLPS